MARDAWILPDEGVLIFWSRKAANSSLARWLAGHVARTRGEEWDGGEPKHFVARHIRAAKPSEALDAIRRDGLRDFILARDPYSRAVSAYVTRFLYYGRRDLARIEALEPSARNLLMKILQRKGLSADQAGAGHPGISFLDFLEYVAGQVERRSGEPDLNAHWNTQTPFLYDGRFEYSRVVRLEDAAAGFEPLRRAVGAAESLPVQHPNAARWKPAGQGDLSEAPSVELIGQGVTAAEANLLTPRTRALIETAYEIDFRKLGYARV